MGFLGTSKHIAVLAAACALAGCGVAAQAVGTTTSAALAPMASMARQANQGLTTMDRTMSTVGRTTTALTRDVASTAGITTRNVNSMANYYAPRRVTTPRTSYKPAPTPSYKSVKQPKMTKEQKDAIEKSKTMKQPDIDVLPEETLSKLTEDQLGLQHAAQQEAFTAPIGEEIFWDLEGRSGTVVAEHENTLGETLCRSFAHTVTIDEEKREKKAVACKDQSTGRWALAF